MRKRQVKKVLRSPWLYRARTLAAAHRKTSGIHSTAVRFAEVRTIQSDLTPQQVGLILEKVGSTNRSRWRLRRPGTVLLRGVSGVRNPDGRWTITYSVAISRRPFSRHFSPIYPKTKLQEFGLN